MLKKGAYDSASFHSLQWRQRLSFSIDPRAFQLTCAKKTMHSASISPPPSHRCSFSPHHMHQASNVISFHLTCTKPTIILPHLHQANNHSASPAPSQQCSLTLPHLHQANNALSFHHMYQANNALIPSHAPSQQCYVLSSRITYTQLAIQSYSISLV